MSLTVNAHPCYCGKLCLFQFQHPTNEPDRQFKKVHDHNTPTMAGGASTATTIPGDDQEALDNARRGTAEVRKRDAEMGVDEGPSASRPKVLRVNSIPVLKTPENKIRKSSTPKQPLDAAPVPAKTTDTTTEDTEPTPSSAAPTGSQPETCKTKKDKKRKKKGKKSKKAKADKNECGTRPIPTPQQNIKPPAVSATEAPTSAAPSQPATMHPEAALTQADRELMEHVENLGGDTREAPAAATSSEASARAPVRAGDSMVKPAAKKAAAKPPYVRSKVEQEVKTSNSPAPAVPEFNESTMTRDERAATQLNNLHRSSTASQYAPSPAPAAPNGAVPLQESDHQKEGDEHKEGADQSDDEEESEESGDLEDELDKEVEGSEPDATQPGESQPKSDSQQVTPTSTQSPKTKKKRRERHRLKRPSTHAT